MNNIITVAGLWPDFALFKKSFWKLIMRVSVLNIILLIAGVKILCATPAFAQDFDRTTVVIELNNETIQTAINQIQHQSAFNFVTPSLRDAKRVNIERKEYNLKQILEHLLATSGLNLGYRLSPNNYITIYELDDENEASGQASNLISTLSIIGRVTEASGDPLPGVNVIVKGTSRGTSTDQEGKFTIEVEMADVLVFSFIGYKTFETKVDQQRTFDVTLQSDATALEEVIVNAGYWDVKDKEATGNIARVSSDVIGKQPVNNALASLQGRMAGVYIDQSTGVPGGDFNIQIRGKNSLRTNGNDPLYVVDGVPFSSEKVSSYYSSAGLFNGNSAGASPLTSLNPSDIQSIEVLKDADATAIYGSRGANGVVLITTKKGKTGKTKFDLNAYTGIGKSQHLQLLNTHQYLAMRREAFANTNMVPSANPNDPAYAKDLMVWDTTRYTDWQKMFIGGNAQKTSIQSSLSGGSANTQFLFSLGYQKETPVFPGDFSYQKKSSHLSVTHTSTDKRLTFSASISGTMDRNNQVSSDYSNEVMTSPDAPAVRDEDGNLNWENSTWTNPLAKLQNTYDSHVNSLVSNIILGYEVLPGLRFKTSAGLNNLSSEELTTLPSTAYDPALNFTSARSSVIRSTGSTQSWIIEPQITYEKNIGKGKLSALAGSTFQDQQFAREANQYNVFPSNALLKNLSAAAQVQKFEYVNTLYRYAAAFGRINYNYSGKYILNITARRDGSSRFGPGKRFGNFGAVGFAWLFSNESFVKSSLSQLSLGKLRASYGVTGSDQIGNYQYLNTYSTNATASNQYQGVPVLNPSRLYNPDYAWESSKKLEVALELGFFEDRLLLATSFYQNRSSNQLVNYALPTTTGFSGVLSNLGATVQNQGVEVELITVNLRPADFQWVTSFNLTIPRNKLISFPGIEASTYANTYVVGKSIYIQKVYESTGVDPQTGLYTFRDFNGDGSITDPADRQKVAFIGQDFYGGINNGFSYGNFKLDIFFQFVKQSGYNYWRTGSAPGDDTNHAAFVLSENRWRKPGDQATIQRYSLRSDPLANAAYARFQSSDGAIGDASFIRLKNVSLSYQFPSKWTKGVNSRIYFQGQNLLLITGYKGFDPENQTLARLAPLKMYTLGVQITL